MTTDTRILKKIQDIKFSKIEELNLNGNLIESIEGLSHIELKFLETIYLCTSESIIVENCIYTTSQIAKFQWPSLDKLSFCTFLELI